MKQLYVIFLTLNIQLIHVFAFPPSPPELSSQTIHNLKGYECGDTFFTYDEIKSSVSLALDSMDKGYRHPQIYQGKLYSDIHSNEYFLYPIKKGRRILPHVKKTETVFNVVLTRDSNEEVDVVAKITIGDYTRCIRIYNTHIGPSHSVPEKPNGYICGTQFFPDETILESLALAQIRNDGNTIYPCPYGGLLFPKESGHLMWPVMREKTLYRQGEANIGPYFLILNKQRQFVDVVIRGYSNNFLRCMRSRKAPKVPASDPLSKLFVTPPKSGYICGKIFFSDAAIQENVQILNRNSGRANKNKILVEHSGPPFNEPYLMWPLLQDGRLFHTGNKGSYRLILTPGFRILNVAMYVNGKLKKCDKRTIKAKKDHDMSKYHCNGQQFNHQQLVQAAEEACSKMKTGNRNFYPARYRGPEFKSDEPCFTYPVYGKTSRKFRSHPGLHRVVINTNCEVVGALTTLEVLISNRLGPDPGPGPGPGPGPSPGFRLEKRLVKCHRLDDGPLPQEFFGDTAETVFEE